MTPTDFHKPRLAAYNCCYLSFHGVVTTTARKRTFAVVSSVGPFIVDDRFEKPLVRHTRTCAIQTTEKRTRLDRLHIKYAISYTIRAPHVRLPSCTILLSFSTRLNSFSKSRTFGDTIHKRFKNNVRRVVAITCRTSRLRNIRFNHSVT